MERETGLEPATSSLGIQTYVGYKITCAFLLRISESATPRRISILQITSANRDTIETSHNVALRAAAPDLRTVMGEESACGEQAWATSTLYIRGVREAFNQRR
jgi:hypothetical protein